MNDPIVSLNKVFFTYNGEIVLNQIDLKVFEGDFVAMIGPNGGGKTTLIKLMLGILKPLKGTVLIMGKPPLKVSHKIGYVPQNVHINRNFPISALDVVLMGTLNPKNRFSPQSRKDRIKSHEALDKMDMGAFCHRKIGELSGGQIQRVFIARALVTDPNLLLLDEPTASIDTKGQNDFYRLLKRLNNDMTIIVVSHDLLVVSRHVKSVACVNKRLHYHHQAEITGDMMASMYPCSVEEECPVELVTHGPLPHRVLKTHEGNSNV